MVILMRWWTPRPGEVELLDWWRPLLAFARLAREEQLPWPIHLDEFACGGRVDRGPRPPIWVYAHRQSGGELLVDPAGRTYRFIEHRRGSSPGRFAEVDARRAMWLAGLPRVVAPVWYEPPVRQPAGWYGEDDDGGAAVDDVEHADGARGGSARAARRHARGAAAHPAGAGGIRRGHLRLVTSHPTQPHRSA